MPCKLQQLQNSFLAGLPVQIPQEVISHLQLDGDTALRTVSEASSSCKAAASHATSAPEDVQIVSKAYLSVCSVTTLRRLEEASICAYADCELSRIACKHALISLNRVSAASSSESK